VIVALFPNFISTAVGPPPTYFNVRLVGFERLLCFGFRSLELDRGPRDDEEDGGKEVQVLVRLLDC
jgi:hypothetical protein